MTIKTCIVCGKKFVANYRSIYKVIDLDGRKVDVCGYNCQNKHNIKYGNKRRVNSRTGY